MLEKIVAAKRLAVAAAKARRPQAALAGEVGRGEHRFSRALAASDWGLIAECKLASPLTGRLSDRRVEELAAIYGRSGAAAISVLTDRHFAGCLQHIRAAGAACGLPVLCKDFVVDEYQLYEAALAGADAVLLIAAVLDDGLLAACLATAAKLGLDCLVEVHTREELERANRLPATLIGINNRDLTTFHTDLGRTFELLPHVAAGRLTISESGVRTGADAVRLKNAGARGCLVGAALVGAADIAGLARELSLKTEGDQDA